MLNELGEGKSYSVKLEEKVQPPRRTMAWHRCMSVGIGISAPRLTLHFQVKVQGGTKRLFPGWENMWWN